MTSPDDKQAYLKETRHTEEVIYNSAEPQHSMTDPRQPASATWTMALAMVKAVLHLTECTPKKITCFAFVHCI